MKSAAASGIGTAVLSALSSGDAAAITGDEPKMFSDAVTHVLNTGNILEPAVTQSSSIGWYVPTSGEQDDYWRHEFAISTTSKAWDRRSSDGSYERDASHISSQHWDLDMSGTTNNYGADFTHYTMNDEKYCGFYPHPDEEVQGLDIADLLFDSLIGAINAPVGGVMVAEDLIQLMIQDVQQGLNNVTNGFTFDNELNEYHEKMIQSHRLVVEVPYDVDTDDEVKVTAWTGGEVGTEVQFTLNFTYYADTAPYSSGSQYNVDSGYEADPQYGEDGADPGTPTKGEGADPETPATLNPRKMSKEQKRKYGVKKVASDNSSEMKYKATNLPLSVEIETKKTDGDY
ncbi:hypothetical protein SY89_00470 [Halolamina pelagica]|uniref:Uncharacterized protein n=1 Tax=Halolamina pelagica TaxID=699431 RepID=A0A0P7GM58_9EURY|nr:hypothetical protein [Halolamina pelagica]KPN29753.1 hypothetical protein SY89_00470 [Halolamina pelagica]